MIEYHNITDIKCSLKNNKWDCDITRLLNKEPTEMDNRICYSKKTETETDLVVIHLEENATKCVLSDTGNGQSMRCTK